MNRNLIIIISNNHSCNKITVANIALRFRFGSMQHESSIRLRFQALEATLDERMRRLFAAAEASAIGYGGISLVSRATGVSRRAIQIGLKELENLSLMTGDKKIKIRKQGGGRKKTRDKDLTLIDDLEKLIEPVDMLNSPLSYTCKSVRQLALDLQERGHQVSHRLVAGLLRDMGFNLQEKNKSSKISTSNRSFRFAHINQQVNRALTRNEPVISVSIQGPLNSDTSLSELPDQMCKTQSHVDKKSETLKSCRTSNLENSKHKPAGKLLRKNINSDTNRSLHHMAWNSISQWWMTDGNQEFHNKKEILVIFHEDKFSLETGIWKSNQPGIKYIPGLKTSICILPPGTSRWNIIEPCFSTCLCRPIPNELLVHYRLYINNIRKS